MATKKLAAPAAKAPVKRSAAVKDVKTVAKRTAAVATSSAVKAKAEPKPRISLLASVSPGRLDMLEKRYGLQGTQVNDFRTRQSYGLLVLDLMTGGGMRPGSWNTFFGGEQSCKSTLAQHALGEVARDDLIPIKTIFDYEGSLDLQYFSNMRGISRRALDLMEIFGTRNSKGEWEIVPRVRQYQAHSAETFFDHLHSLLKFMPDKRELNGEWFEVYDADDKEHKSIVGTNYSKTLSKEHGGLWVPTDNGLTQGIAMLDSYPSMLPKNMDEEGKGAGMGAQARMFAEHIRRVKGRMGPKRFTIMGINQIRQKPGVTYGDPNYEPGGEALKFYSDVRIRTTSRVMQGVKYNENKLEEEAAVGGGIDSYRYVQMVSIKNKLGGIPHSKCWVRVWVADNGAKARGFDPVFDVFQFLKMCGKISGTKNRLLINLPEFNDGQHKVLNWLDFKTLCLGDKQQITEICNHIGVKANHLALTCQKHLRAGTAYDWYVHATRGGGNIEEAADNAIEGDSEHSTTSLN